jgi:nitroreductase
MSDLLTTMKKRRSVRDYTDKPVEEEKIRDVVEAARIAPSSCNSQCWRFVVARGETRDEIVKKGLGGLAIPNRWVKTAPVIIVACADLNLLTHKIGARIKGIEYHMLDMGIAIEHLVLRATELGFGTCWIGWFNDREIHRILKIPGGVKIVTLLSLGYPKEALKEHKKQRLATEKMLFWGKYGEIKEGFTKHRI